ncbi:xanthine dehydrogenase family protein molybdopterin-binding subunit [Haliangium sp.]|uniref:xanthine dehydrogenase family protein molybdopterin-binding subunit n=1 Tax=Haliangium sp. TaxID=2663208 RepID=UPI003D0A6AAF
MPALAPPPASDPAVGRSVRRKDSAAKVTGRARYIDDLRFDDMLYGRTIRSTIARGRVRSISLGFDADQFVVVDHRDIPGKNCVHVIDDDQPCLVEDEVRHAAEPILLLAHPDRETLWQAQVDIAYEPLPPLFDPAASGHSFKDISVDKGAIEEGMAAAELIVEGEYRTGHHEQLYIETNGMIAVPEADGSITIYGSMQCPYYVHEALTTLLGWPGERVRVVQTETGGGFGGKEEYPSMIAAHAALLALKAKRPVKLVYDRHEDLIATTKRHPSIVRHRTGVRRDGTLTAMDIDVLMDAGAYCTLSPVVLSRGVLHATGPYRCDHVRVRGRTVMTNTPPNGAFRGFGAPQTLFAVEVHMDRIAATLGMDPVELRRKNALRPGDTTATGQRMDHSCSALAVLEQAVERSGYHDKRKAWAGTDRGIGVSLYFHGSGFTGAGETYLASKAALELTETGVRILVASTEIGQGTRTMHAQIVADTLGIPYERVEVAQPDTAQVPNSGPTVASRTTMVVGEILTRCARTLKARLGGLEPGAYLRAHGPLVVTEEYRRPDELEDWDEERYRGAAYPAYGWACNVAEVELDRDTYEVRPLRVTAVAEIGKAIHPVMAAGQIEGGTAQGVGFALNERVVMQDGVMANANMTNYTIPTTRDTPEIDVVIMENPYLHGPFGAKGVGEMPIDGPAPAVVNAIRQLGVDVRALPATPEAIMEAVCSSS